MQAFSVPYLKNGISLTIPHVFSISRQNQEHFTSREPDELPESIIWPMAKENLVLTPPLLSTRQRNFEPANFLHSSSAGCGTPSRHSESWTNKKLSIALILRSTQAISAGTETQSDLLPLKKVCPNLRIRSAGSALRAKCWLEFQVELAQNNCSGCWSLLNQPSPPKMSQTQLGLPCKPRPQ